MVASMKFARVALMATVLVSLCGCDKKTEDHLLAERGDAEAHNLMMLLTGAYVLA